ncbi:MAG: hypothetical protein KJ915_08770 [Candidatus Omnitrophica bacterium]|nr:hypothetical protein [Candidatus Omnitrophota bacterium]
MDNWKENKVVGIVAIAVAILVAIVVIKMVSSRNALTTSEKQEIEAKNVRGKWLPK